jgi:hypothetical protein
VPAAIAAAIDIGQLIDVYNVPAVAVLIKIYQPTDVVYWVPVAVQQQHLSENWLTPGNLLLLQLLSILIS